MSTLDEAGALSVAPPWRCPHCRTLQPAASTCRTCARATVSCSTCVRYRRSVVNSVGYCADDRARTPLRGDELRGCWSDGRDARRDAMTSGLFDDLHPVEPAMPPRAPAAPADARDLSPPRADRPVDGLVEAPHVAPSGEFVSALRRRARQSRQA